MPPPGQNVLSDSPDSADTLSFPVENGDVILAATDGVFDNVPADLLLDILKTVSVSGQLATLIRPQRMTTGREINNK